MIAVGITGQSGFIGTHLFKVLGEQPSKFVCVPFEDSFFDDDAKLKDFVRKCNVIVHLAALVRSKIEGEVYNVNMRLVHQLIDAMEQEKVTPCILFSTSIQEGNGSEYGQSKLEIRLLLEEWAQNHNTGFQSLVFPNLFGPGARPNSHSFIATFCYKLTHNDIPQIIVDNVVRLKYINNLMKELPGIIESVVVERSISTTIFPPEFEMKVSEVLSTLKRFVNGECPDGPIEDALYETLMSYYDY